MSTVLNVRVPAQLAERIEALTKQPKYRSKSDAVRDCIEEYLDRR